METPLYDAFSDDYDRFVNWEGRLSAEMPFIEEQLASVGARNVLDTACGTGMHALALAERGFAVTGADLSKGMVQRAGANAASRGQDVRFIVAGFGDLAERVGGKFDALLCLGNSLPHILTREGLSAALADFAQVLRPGGLLLIQNRNFDMVLRQRERWMSPQAHQEPGQEWIFVRFYDFDADDLLTFNVMTLYRKDSGSWQQFATATRLWPLRRDALMAALEAKSFCDIRCLGDMTGTPFDPTTSGNLIVTAHVRRESDEEALA